MKITSIPVSIYKGFKNFKRNICSFDIFLKYLFLFYFIIRKVWLVICYTDTNGLFQWLYICEMKKMTLSSSMPWSQLLGHILSQCKSNTWQTSLLASRQMKILLTGPNSFLNDGVSREKTDVYFRGNVTGQYRKM